MKYRLRGMVNIEVEAYEDGSFHISDKHDCYWTQTDFDELGLTLEPIENPDNDPPGTIRRFLLSGDLIFKDPEGNWRWASEHMHHTILDDFPKGYMSNEVVELP